ncbi:helix-turn-helix domain-containing protein [Streptomyces sp. NPDC059477]|uniref:helix-turn-helix domain-containing protein n=1 Tax=Streptomyces sp. NPDC059477 TaxID=3346847 RepID=UPI00368F54E5
MPPLSLRRLVGALPQGAVTSLTEGGPEVVTGVDLLDCPDAVGGLPPGLLLLGVGLDPGGTAAGEALRTAARCSAALAVKTPLPAAPALLEQARREGVAVLAVDPQVPWSRIQHMVGTLLAAPSATVGRGGERPAGGDLFALADALAAIVGGAVAIMDVHRIVVAYSTLPGQPIDDTRRRGILSRQVPEDAVADHLDRELWRADSVVRHHRPGDLPRMAVAIRAGMDVLGSLWVAFPPDGPAGDFEAALREAAGVAALHMLALRRQIDADQDSRNQALRAALDPPRPGKSPPGEPSGASAGLLLPGVLVGLAEASVSPSPTGSPESTAPRTRKGSPDAPAPRTRTRSTDSTAPPNPTGSPTGSPDPTASPVPTASTAQTPRPAQTPPPAQTSPLPPPPVPTPPPTESAPRTTPEEARRRCRADLLRLLDLVALDGRSLGYEPAAAVIGGRLYALLPAASGAAVPFGQLLDHLLQRAYRATRRRYVAVRTDADVAPPGLRIARHDIDAALDHLDDTGAEAGLYRIGDLRADLVLRRLLRTVRERADLRTGTAERIAAHDAEHGTEFLTTLAAYLRHFGEVAPASAALHVHQNTLRQRLRKAERIFGLPLEDPTLRLLLAVELAAVQGGPAGRPHGDGPLPGTR